MVNQIATSPARTGHVLHRFANPGRFLRLAAKVQPYLTVAALVLMIGSFVLVAEFSGAPPRSVYVPAHMQDGKLIPGTIK